MNEITEAQKLAIEKIIAWEKQLDGYDEAADALEHERDALEARWNDAKYRALEVSWGDAKNHGVH